MNIDEIRFISRNCELELSLHSIYMISLVARQRNYQIFHDRVLESLLNPIEETDPFANVMTAQGSSLKPKLTTSQVAIAKRLGVTAKEYAELLKILE